MNNKGYTETGMVTTSSRLRMWWLAKFRGYKVRLVKRMPKRAMFGTLTYETVWVLMRPKPEDKT